MSHIQVKYYGKKFANVPWYPTNSYVNTRIYYIYGGTGFYNGNNGTVRLKPGFVYFIPYLSKPNYLEQDDSDPIHHIAIDCDIFPVPLSDSFKEINVAEDPLLSEYVKLMELFYPEEPTALDLRSTRSSDTNPRIHSMVSLIKAYVTYILDTYSIALCPDSRVNDTIRYISENCSGKISVSELSAKLGLDEHYFVTMFRKNVGLTPYQYYIQCRVELADRMMTEGMSITQVSEELGFNDLASFSNAYKKVKGYSPRKYYENGDN